MKKSFLFYLLIACFYGLNAQIVNIPDANFKAKLIALGVDTNVDGQIQQTEALAVTSLNVSNSNINNIIGIEAFINIDTLICHNNNLLGFDIGTLTNLQKLDCHNNILQYPLTISPNNLKYLDCSENFLSEDNINFNLFSNLEYLDFRSNSYSTLPLQNQYINLSNLTNLIYLNCGENGLVSLDVSACTNLETLKCVFCTLSNIVLGNLTNLKTLSCDFNQLSNLNIGSLVSLQNLSCSYNYLPNLSVNNLTNLRHLDCSNTSLSTIDLSNLTDLRCLYCLNNQLQTLDLSNCIALDSVYCDNNQLFNLFLKNGKNETVLEFSNNTALQYICIDTNQYTSVTQKVLQYGLSNTFINTFCTFPPGGNYNSVSGTSYYDINQNGCAIGDPIFPFLMIGLTNGINTTYGFTNQLGHYDAYIDSGTWTFNLMPQNPTYYSASPTTFSTYFSNSNQNVQVQDICVSSNGVFPDVEIIVLPLTNAQPGFDATYKIIVKNNGTTAASGDITFDFMGNKMTFLGAIPTPISQNTNQIMWSYNNILPFQTTTIIVNMNILTLPFNNIGDTLNFMGHVSLTNDIDTTNNVMMLPHVIIGAYDPNDKTCLEGEYVSNTEIGDYLHYLIRFQNTGNYYAEKVVVIDSIDASKFDIASLQILDVSHNVQIRVENNTIEFYFDQIMLPDSFTNEPASHGHILFKIKTHNNLSFNSTIKNKAEIYFDYNPPIITNYATTHFYSDCANFTTNVLLTPVTCNGLCDGMISTNPIGAIGPYTYSWSNGATSSTLNNVCAGTYWVNVADASGCILSNTFVINEPAPLTINIDTIIHALNNANGAIIIEPTGGTTPYTYLWSNGQSSQNATQLVSGVYGITIIDANACEFTLSNIVVSEIVNIENALPTDYTISPNPAQNELIIKVDKETELTIYNYLGQKITHFTIYGKQNVDISFLAKGLYWIKEKYSQKFFSFVKE